MKKTLCAQKSDIKELIKAIQPPLHKAVCIACRKYLFQADNTLIKDFCEEITLRLIEDDYRRLKSFENRSLQETWLGQIAKNHVVNYVKRQKPAERLEEKRADDFQVPPPQEKELLQHEREEVLAWALQSLTVRDRELYDLLFRQELQAEEISKQMGIQLGQVRKRKNKLVNKLRHLIEGGGRLENFKEIA